MVMAYREREGSVDGGVGGVVVVVVASIHFREESVMRSGGH
jgi:hypothetical protein